MWPTLPPPFTICASGWTLTWQHANNCGSMTQPRGIGCATSGGPKQPFQQPKKKMPRAARTSGRVGSVIGLTHSFKHMGKMGAHSHKKGAQENDNEQSLDLAGMSLVITAAIVAAIGILAVAVVRAQSDSTHPTNLTGEIESDGVVLQWHAPNTDAGSVTGYENLRRRPLQGETVLQILVADTESRDTTYTDTSATTPGEGYVYRVKAWRGTAKSRHSNFVRLDILARCPPALRSRRRPPRRQRRRPDSHLPGQSGSSQAAIWG